MGVFLYHSLSAETIRQQALNARRRLSPETITEYSHTIVKKIRQHPRFIESQKIALYYPSFDEVSLLDLLSEKNKEFYLPRILKNFELAFLRFKQGNPLISNAYGILEPDAKNAESTKIDINHLDLIFVPLVAFDAQAHRLGRGKGYYDRSLANTREKIHRPYLIGPAFECQRVEVLPQESHDIPLDEIVTESIVSPRKSR